jgi:hypothetical protein
MVPLNTVANVEYIGNDSAYQFPITFPTFENSNILASVVDALDVETPLVLGVDFSLQNIGRAGTNAQLTLIDAGQAWLSSSMLATGYTLRIQFSPVAFQPARLRTLGAFAPEAIEKSLDRLTMNVLALKDTLVTAITVVANGVFALESDMVQAQADIDNLEIDMLAAETVINDHEIRIDALEAVNTAFIVQPQGASFTAEYDKLHITSGTLIVQLPAPVANKLIRIKKSDNGILTLVRNAVEQIDGVSANKSFASTKESITLVTDGTNWFLI